MAYSALTTVSPGDLWDAGDFNQCGDNFSANVPDIFTTAGQMYSASGANALAALAPPAGVQQALVANSAAAGGIAWAGGVVPIGMIIIWSGAIAAIPAGWQLCDGTGGTPDLRGKFVAGAGSAYAVGDNGAGSNLAHTHTANQASTDSGGSHTHTQGVTGSEAAHTHAVTAGSFGAASTTIDVSIRATNTLAAASTTHTHAFNAATGQGAFHTHTNPTTGTSSPANHTHTQGASNQALTGTYWPSYYALAYIMRTS